LAGLVSGMAGFAFGRVMAIIARSFCVVANIFILFIY
jgi:hypothetical protein